MKAMILAAGFGSRFKPHSLRIPKPQFPFLNVPMGFHCFHFLKSAGVDSLVVNTHHLPENIVSLYQSQNKFKVEFSPEPDFILGSSGGLKKAQRFFKNEKTFLMLNADEIILSPHLDIVSKLINQHEKEKNIATLLVTDHAEVGSKFGGVWVDSKNSIVGFGKNKPEAAVKGFHFIGIQALQSEVFNLIPENKEQNIFYDTLMDAIKAGARASVHPINCHWFETGNLSDYLLAIKSSLKLLKENSKEIHSLTELLKRFSPNSNWLNHLGQYVWGDKGSSLINTKVSGFCVIGENVSLKNVQIENAVISNGAQLQNSQIKEDLLISY